MARAGRLLAAVAMVGGIAAGSAQAQDLPLFGPVYLAGDGPTYLDLALGDYAALDDHPHYRTLGGRAELRFGDKFLFLGPAVGAAINAHGAVEGYAGIYTELHIGPIVITPLTSIGVYHHGDSADKNLHGALEFRSELMASYQFDNGMQLGAMFAHMSNANIYPYNPGENELMVRFALPLTF